MISDRVKKSFIRYGLALAIWVLQAAPPCACSPVEAGVSAVLAGLGMENLRVAVDPEGTIRVEYENRVYRSELMAAGIVAAVVARRAPSSPVLLLTPLNRGVPICEIIVDLDAHRRFLNHEMDDKAYASTLRVRESGAKSHEHAAIRPSFGRIDLTVYPGTTLHLGNYDDRFKIMGYLLPELAAQLWPGANFSGRLVIPLHDEIGVYSNEVRPCRAVLSQSVRIPMQGFLLAHAGLFEPDRWGVSTEVGYHLFERRVALGMTVDYTGFLLYQHRRWRYSRIGRLTARACFSYYLDAYDIEIGLGYGKFLLGDKGWLAEARRTWNETELGLCFAVTDVDKFGGVQLTVPLPPFKRPRPAALRLTPPRTLSWNYRATSKVNTYGAPALTGLAVSAGTSVKQLQKRMFGPYIRNNIALWREAPGCLR